MRSKNEKYVVIVESPSKISTISGYLDSNYTVISSVGHIRQIKKKPNSVTLKTNEAADSTNNRFHFEWETDEIKLEKILNTIKYVNPTEIILGFDEDREGEAIAFHMQELLRQHNINSKITRMRFNEITKPSIQKALQNRGNINYDLVNAYLIRCGLDYKMGFDLSGSLRRFFNKCFKDLSAGRVQTPVLVEIVNRELTRRAFQHQFSYSIEGKLINQNKLAIDASLEKYNGKKCNPIATKEEADQIVLDKDFIVSSIKSKNVKVSAPTPFTTSSLQQDCYNKLGFSIGKTMKIAQELFNKGFITYMRTDSLFISEEFLPTIHAYIDKHYKQYKTEPRQFKNKIKNAQEAHECIRPTNINTLKVNIDDDHQAVYTAIHCRIVACQMADAIREQNTVILESKRCEMKYNHSRITFKGFKAIEESESTAELNIKEKDKFELKSFEVLEHKTEPPSRYSEATIVKMMEETGIGRPSTYANIIRTLLEREFIAIEKRQLKPTTKGEIIGSFMRNMFEKYSNSEFTANMENILDQVSMGEENVDSVLPIYLEELSTKIQEVVNTDLFNIMSKITEHLTKKLCPSCKQPMQLGIKYSPFFICKICKVIEKFDEEKLDLSDTHFEIFESDNYTTIKYIGKTLILPKNSAPNINIDMVRFLVCLPKKIGVYKDKNVIVSCNKRGFVMIWNNQYYNTSLTEIYNTDNIDIANIIQKQSALLDNNKKQNRIYSDKTTGPRTTWGKKNSTN